MFYVYYVDGKKFTTDTFDKIPKNNISSPNENIPAIEDRNTKYKEWCDKGNIIHRLTGPAIIHANGSEWFYLNNIFYENIRDWINNHPNPDLYFDAIGLTETDRVLWFLQN
jgi:hypothetical protein